MVSRQWAFRVSCSLAATGEQTGVLLLMPVRRWAGAFAIRPDRNFRMDIRGILSPSLPSPRSSCAAMHLVPVSYQCLALDGAARRVACQAQDDTIEEVLGGSKTASIKPLVPNDSQKSISHVSQRRCGCPCVRFASVFSVRRASARLTQFDRVDNLQLPSAAHLRNYPTFVITKQYVA